jgi:hypothetical protein
VALVHSDGLGIIGATQINPILNVAVRPNEVRAVILHLTGSNTELREP